MERDPVKLFEAQLELAKVLTTEEAQAIHNEIQGEVDEAIEYAEASPMPDPLTDMLTDVYTEAS
jgi:pyruvate dehydrogenase E1 component alpha subunit